MEYINDFHFIRPLWLIVLIFPILIYLRYFKGTKNKSSWEKVVDKHLLDFLQNREISNDRKKIGYIIMTGIISSIIILSAPVWNKKEVPNLVPINPNIILLNLSSDMKDNLEIAKYKIIDFIEENKSSQNSLIVYSDEPFIITPITSDNEIIKNIIPNINLSIMPNNGDKLYRAIELAKTNLENAKFNHGNIIIFANDIGEDFDKAIQISKKISNKYNIYISELEGQNIDKLSHIIKPQDIKNIANKISNKIKNHEQDSKNKSEIWIEYGYYFLIIPLLCCLYIFKKGLLIIALVLSSTTIVHAGFFTNQNQDGLKLFNDKEYEKAAKTFQDEDWIGSSLYKLGEYESSIKHFSNKEDKTTKYNLGNALAKSGEIEKAIEKYEEVLAIDPNHEDAKFNLEYLKQQKENQNNSSDDSSDDNKDNKEQNKDEESQDNNQNNEEQQNDNSESSSDNNSNDNKDNNDNENSEEQENQDFESNTNQNNKEKDDKDSDAMSEEIQKREQTYRKIPDNPSGLIRAFIRKEYLKRRYQ